MKISDEGFEKTVTEPRISEIKRLRELRKMINPERIIKQKIESAIKKGAFDLVCGKSITVDIDLNNFNNALSHKILREYREAGFKIRMIRANDKRKVKIKL